MCFYALCFYLRVQGAALKYLPSIIPDIINGNVLDRREFTQLLIQLISNIPEGLLTKTKLVCMQEIVNSPMFKYAGKIHPRVQTNSVMYHNELSYK